MRFLKYQGIGNDFILLDARTAPHKLSRSLIQKLCRRHFGVGADGLLLVETGPRMRIYNADGSLAEMCGNGLRCVARYLEEQGEAPEWIQTDAGAKRVDVKRGEISVEMGAAQDGGLLSLKLRGRELQGHRVDLGNPHFVLFGDWDEEQARIWGPQIEQHPSFSEGVNVSFAQLKRSQQLQLWVWERGCGLTLACGTGACATVAVGCWERILEPPVEVLLPGGVLRISGTPEAQILSGAAKRVFAGELSVGS